MSNSRTDARKGIPMRELTYEEMAMVTGGSADPKSANCPWMLSKTPSTSGGDSGIPTITITAPSRGGGGGGGGGDIGDSYGERLGQCFAENWRNDMRDGLIAGLVGGARFGFGAGNLGAPGVGGIAGAVGGAAIGAAGALVAAPVWTGVNCAVFPNR